MVLIPSILPFNNGTQVHLGPWGTASCSVPGTSVEDEWALSLSPGLIMWRARREGIEGGRALWWKGGSQTRPSWQSLTTLSWPFWNPPALAVYSFIYLPSPGLKKAEIVGSNIRDCIINVSSWGVKVPCKYKILYFQPFGVQPLFRTIIMYKIDGLLKAFIIEWGFWLLHFGGVFFFLYVRRNTRIL